MKYKKSDKGFTLIEILIAIGILALIASLGLFISMDFFRGYSFRSEENTIVSILQKARSQSMDNIDQVRHGVSFQPGKYVIFECPVVPVGTPPCNYAGRNASQDIIINPNYGSSISNPVPPFDVVFEQLNGDCITSNCSTAPLTITANDGNKSFNISINSEGRIDW